MHLLSREVNLKRSSTVRTVKEGLVPVGRERSREYRNVCSSSHHQYRTASERGGRTSKDGLERLVEDVAHLVLKVLSSDERVEKIRASSSEVDRDFYDIHRQAWTYRDTCEGGRTSTSASDTLVLVERLPMR